MNYYINKTIDLTFSEAVEAITLKLKDQGFGVLTEINMKEVLKKKLDKDIRPYVILGACNPNFAYNALSKEEKIGILLPCNVTIIEREDGKIDVSVIDPSIAMSVVENPGLKDLSEEVRLKLQAALNSI